MPSSRSSFDRVLSLIVRPCRGREDQIVLSEDLASRNTAIARRDNGTRCSLPFFAPDATANPALLAAEPHTISRGIRAQLQNRPHIVPSRDAGEEKTGKPLAPITWIQRLKRVFATDIETCPKSGDKLLVTLASRTPTSSSQSSSAFEHATRPNRHNRERHPLRTSSL